MRRAEASPGDSPEYGGLALAWFAYVGGSSGGSSGGSRLFSLAVGTHAFALCFSCRSSCRFSCRSCWDGACWDIAQGLVLKAGCLRCRVFGLSVGGWPAGGKHSAVSITRRPAPCAHQQHPMGFISSSAQQSIPWAGAHRQSKASHGLAPIGRAKHRAARSPAKQKQSAHTGRP